MLSGHGLVRRMERPSDRPPRARRIFRPSTCKIATLPISGRWPLIGSRLPQMSYKRRFRRSRGAPMQRIGFVALPGFQMLSVGVLSVFEYANNAGVGRIGRDIIAHDDPNADR